jgi:hypothetical protein
MVAQRMHGEEIEPGSILLFFLLLMAFIAILALRAHLLVPVGTRAAMAAPSAPAATLIAKALSLRPGF